jgi:hypothetical protein
VSAIFSAISSPILAAIVVAPLAGWPAVAAGTAAARPRARADQPITTTCEDALADGTLTDPGQARGLAALAAQLKWSDGDPFGPPGQCHLAVRLRCGPDLDHDGDAEGIVEVTWWQADDCAAAERGGEPAPVTKTFLASRHGSAWRAIAPLATASGDEAARRSYFVKRADGRAAVRIEWTVATSDSGCTLGGYEVFTLRAGALRRLERGNRSHACLRCGCDDH